MPQRCVHESHYSWASPPLLLGWRFLRLFELTRRGSNKPRAVSHSCYGMSIRAWARYTSAPTGPFCRQPYPFPPRKPPTLPRKLPPGAIPTLPSKHPRLMEWFRQLVTESQTCSILQWATQAVLLRVRLDSGSCCTTSADRWSEPSVG